MAINWADTATTGGIIAVITAISGGIIKIISVFKKNNPVKEIVEQLNTELIVMREQIKTLQEQNKKDEQTRETVLNMQPRLETAERDIEHLRNNDANIYERLNNIKG